MTIPDVISPILSICDIYIENYRTLSYFCVDGIGNKLAIKHEVDYSWVNVYGMMIHMPNYGNIDDIESLELDLNMPWIKEIHRLRGIR